MIFLQNLWNALIFTSFEQWSRNCNKNIPPHVYILNPKQGRNAWLVSKWKWFKVEALQICRYKKKMDLSWGWCVINRSSLFSFGKLIYICKQNSCTHHIYVLDSGYIEHDPILVWLTHLILCFCSVKVIHEYEYEYILIWPC